MKDRFDYADLKDMLEVAKIDNDSLAYRLEIVKEICELPTIRIDWTKADKRQLYYYATTGESLPLDPWMFRCEFLRDSKELGIYLS